MPKEFVLLIFSLQWHTHNENCIQNSSSRSSIIVDGRKEMNEINLPSKLIVEVECIVVPLLDAHSLCECECGEKGNEKVEAPFYGSVEIKGFDALMRNEN